MHELSRDVLRELIPLSRKAARHPGSMTHEEADRLESLRAKSRRMARSNDMSGRVRRRGRNSWELKFDIGRDEKTGRRIIQYYSFRGTKKEAGFKLAELIASVGKGSYVQRSSVTVHELSAARSNNGKCLAKSDPRRRSVIMSFLQTKFSRISAISPYRN